MIMIYNTLSKKKETLKGKDEENISFFVCGPTVYDYAHIGHARTYVSFDSFVKFLRKNNYNIFYLQNITDIDDKIIQRAREKKQSPSDLAKKFEKEYLKDMKLLSVDSVSEYARATDHISEIISQTERLLEKGFAYLAEDGVYYDISKFKDYGKLSGRTTKQAEDGTSRIDESVKKRNKGDFCIWKFSKEDEPQWESPWGKGRPGWHIEDTAIAEKFFGQQYDIHGGGRDLMFPHHEAEITIMESISGKVPFVSYWMHAGFLTVEGEKMSKSLNNFVTIKDFIEKHSSRVLRFLVLKSHYRSPFDYDNNKISQAREELRKIDQFICSMEEKNVCFESHETEEIIKKYRKEINDALIDDFNTPIAIASLFSFISEVNSKGEEIDRDKVEKFLRELDSVFGFIIVPQEERLVKYLCVETGKFELTGIDINIKTLAEEREMARRKKDFEKADEIRKEIESLGYTVEDTEKECKIKKIN